MCCALHNMSQRQTHIFCGEKTICWVLKQPLAAKTFWIFHCDNVPQYLASRHSLVAAAVDWKSSPPSLSILSQLWLGTESQWWASGFYCDKNSGLNSLNTICWMSILNQSVQVLFVNNLFLVLFFFFFYWVQHSSNMSVDVSGTNWAFVFREFTSFCHLCTVGKMSFQRIKWICWVAASNCTATNSVYYLSRTVYLQCWVYKCKLVTKPAMVIISAFWEKVNTEKVLHLKQVITPPLLYLLSSYSVTWHLQKAIKKTANCNNLSSFSGTHHTFLFPTISYMCFFLICHIAFARWEEFNIFGPSFWSQVLREPAEMMCWRGRW